MRDCATFLGRVSFLRFATRSRSSGRLLAASVIRSAYTNINAHAHIRVTELENATAPPEITGGTGSTGVSGHVGGEGGEEGPQIDMDPSKRAQIGSVSGQGMGGAGVQVGGKGGTGKGPVTNLRWMRPLMSPKRQSQVDPIL
ncbi:hypothetical protein MSAN_02437000 [Mycena sanguinolenta]|uniref:Uncharacterized protein n=1 Tax=Mycena sanguinolenta TaxID=230812 RepID=A0A8H6WYW3_9AGAR|nr:hypothetical protein MSAN_02437000 [Mycena sanguinolenta]